MDLLKRITDFYLSSRDFNGIPLSTLATSEDRGRLSIALAALVRDELVSIVFGDRHPNPHIRALPDHHSPDSQVQLLETDAWRHACAYPLPKHLATVIQKLDYAGRPYALALALGEPQLVHHAFDLTVLEPYRNDPRYSFTTDDIYGSISVHEAETAGSGLPPHDEVLMQSFGFAYDNELNKYVAAFTWDLFKLTPEHQQDWKRKEVSLETTLHPDYFLSQVLGEWPKKVSIYQAFIEELQVINRMAAAMGRPPLFREDFSEHDRPREFFSLLRPTAREFDTFCHLLDKLLSDNLSKDFFLDDVRTEHEAARSGGKVLIQPKGTIALLEEWVRARFRAVDTGPLDELFVALREVRRLRQKPAHAVNSNAFDQQYLRRQRELMVQAYTALRTLRLILANHPLAKGVEIPQHLFAGDIWSR